MALFDNVTYDYYTTVLGRSEVPDAVAFNKYKLENVMHLRMLYDAGLIFERDTNGIDSACCLMIEEDYKGEEITKGSGNIETSENIGGYSYSVNTKAYEIALEKNAKSTAEKKYKWLSLYCDIVNGGR